jgi:hypothetical protein
MFDFEISDFLELREKSRGRCKACFKIVSWCKERVASHKRSNCERADEATKRKFAKRLSDGYSNLAGSSNWTGFSNDANASTNSIDFENYENDEVKFNEINSNLAEFFLRTGIALRLVESEAFKKFVASLNPAFAKQLPCAKTLSGPMLDQQYDKYKRVIDEIVENSHQLTLVSDGWTNIRGDHIVNFCVSAPGQKPFFYTSICTSGIIQNPKAIADEIKKVIDDLGAEKFVALVTDNAPSMKAAWKIIEEKYPHISAYGCSAHGVNLLLKDICSTSDRENTMKKAEKIIKFIKNHHIVKAKYEELRREAKVPHTLSMPVVTRWFSRYTAMDGLLASKYVLTRLVDASEDTLRKIEPKTTSKTVIDLIKNASFWSELKKLVNVLEYPSNVIGNIFIIRQNF